MRIAVPLSRLEEIEPLAAAGADEFYCSVVPEEWLTRFGQKAVSRRPFGNLSSEADLPVAQQKVLSLGAELALVMNAQQYTSEQMDCLTDLVRRFVARGGGVVIVAEPVLLSLLAAEFPQLKLHVSSISSCRNARSVSFFQKLGAHRIILPRDMTLKEMERLTGTNTDLEYEAFILNDGCVFEEGVCHSIHLPPALGGAICMDRYQYNYHRTDGHTPGTEEMDALRENDRYYQTWLWRRFSNGFSVTADGYPFGPCGLCALSALESMGVTSAKIAGRDAPLQRKLKSVEMVRRMTDLMHEGVGQQELMQCAQGVRGEMHRCKNSEMCYYPDLMRTQFRG